jgi:hypothetical protein
MVETTGGSVVVATTVVVMALSVKGGVGNTIEVMIQSSSTVRELIGYVAEEFVDCPRKHER